MGLRSFCVLDALAVTQAAFQLFEDVADGFPIGSICTQKAEESQAKCRRPTRSFSNRPSESPHAVVWHRLRTGGA